MFWLNFVLLLLSSFGAIDFDFLGLVLQNCVLLLDFYSVYLFGVQIIKNEMRNIDDFDCCHDGNYCISSI